MDKTSQNTLCHFGIKGQKWGVQNGPPYPLKKEAEDLFNNRMTMSDEEFRNKLDRLMKEIELGKKLGYKEAYQLDRAKGKSWIKKFIEQFSDNSARQMGIQLGVRMGQLVNPSAKPKK